MKYFADHRLFFALALVAILSWIYSYKKYKSSIENIEFSEDVMQLLAFEEEIDKIREIVDDIAINERQNSLRRLKEKSYENIKIVERIVEKKVNIEDEYPHKPWKHQKLDEYIGEHGKSDSNSCAKKENIYFLKTSKTGGTTFANILQRFGYSKIFDNEIKQFF